ncbi:tail fiber assembly protein [Salmonella enterica subsp. enterica]|nr:tail fiber assembly protein [Salmonella enterica subsp. enterica]ECI1497860.1 tail fiber assembly protein [Salmonella enterica subsp. enterica serovar Kentucky]EDE2634486.1 hypothetical protein [Salmonella enterica subsp. enterica serovar Blijdorp]EDT5581040.1 tail fiber assembly protein [Salmonella enterica subsp. enterica serovar Choleraesuis]HAF4749126.1 tail fiber assembly protein [Salmonella enterica]
MGKKVRWWVLDILDREVGFTGAKYRVLVNRVDTSNPDRPEHQTDKIVLLISNQWHINCTSSDSNRQSA